MSLPPSLFRFAVNKIEIRDQCIVVFPTSFGVELFKSYFEDGNNLNEKSDNFCVLYGRDFGITASNLLKNLQSTKQVLFIDVDQFLLTLDELHNAKFTESVRNEIGNLNLKEVEEAFISATAQVTVTMDKNKFFVGTSALNTHELAVRLPNGEARMLGSHIETKLVNNKLTLWSGKNIRLLTNETIDWIADLIKENWVDKSLYSGKNKGMFSKDLRLFVEGLLELTDGHPLFFHSSLNTVKAIFEDEKDFFIENKLLIKNETGKRVNINYLLQRAKSDFLELKELSYIKRSLHLLNRSKDPFELSAKSYLVETILGNDPALPDSKAQDYLETTGLCYNDKRELKLKIPGSYLKQLIRNHLELPAYVSFTNNADEENNGTVEFHVKNVSHHVKVSGKQWLFLRLLIQRHPETVPSSKIMAELNINDVQSLRTIASRVNRTFRNRELPSFVQSKRGMGYHLNLEATNVFNSNPEIG